MGQGLPEKWIGPIPLNLFFEKFMAISLETLASIPDIPTSHFDDVYDSFLTLVQEAKLLPDFGLVDMDSEKIQPDIFVYKKDVGLGSNLAPFDNLELPIIFQSASSSTASPHDSSDAEYDTIGNIKAESCGRIGTYFTEMVNRQHRTHAFLIFFEDHIVRFFVTQRNGTAFSAPFSFRTNPHPLLEFLWRFGNMTDSERGHDPTVRLATAAEADAARKALMHEHAPRDVSSPFVVLGVPQQANDGKPLREVVAWGSFAAPHSLHGRATRVWPVYDLATKTLALLKDMWRPVEDDKESEVDTLRKLQRAQVRNIPKLICGGDIAGQTISLHQYRNASWIKSEADGSVWTPRCHTRFLTETIAIPLHKFTSSKQMLRVITDALTAHEDAYVKLGIIHRDVSINNILISKDGRGILNDWDMALPINRPPPIITQLPQRTGTWAFMSIKLLGNPNAPHSLEDDLESFCYVLLYTALRYLPHNKLDRLSMIMHRVFERHNFDIDGNAYGGDGKMNILSTIPNDSYFTNNPAMSSLSKAILDILFQIIVWNVSRAINPKSVSTPPNPLTMHTNLGEIFEAHLRRNDWPEEDAAARDRYETAEPSEDDLPMHQNIPEKTEPYNLTSGVLHKNVHAFDSQASCEGSDGLSDS